MRGHWPASDQQGLVDLPRRGAGRFGPRATRQLRTLGELLLAFGFADDEVTALEV
ncbi:hypothetical protein [Nocardia sp. NPDC020380]|uniref:hypothetical protein n=1 Tax=Nocardia sp. NPDC020380 TaxID=3364309 RepID=UPI0037B996A6